MGAHFKKFIIPFSVFVTGSCVLVIEIIAIRILAPYFGNTIFTVSSVITVVLAALSFGYYAGGKLADKYPEEKLFYGIITISGFSVIFFHLLGIVFLASFGYKLSIIEGPLVSSFLLFFLQSFFLGTLSPFAIKLQKVRVEQIGIGNVSGQIFFWSTLGSIFGSLSAGFFLIPNFGIDKIILGVGFLLIILGLAGILKTNIYEKLSLLVLALFIALLSLSNFKLSAKNAVYFKDSLYQKIIIYDGIYKGRPARFLRQDLNSSSAKFIDSDELVYEYTKYYILYQVFNPDIKNALMIGGGAYSVPKVILSDLPQASVDVAEIDPILFDLGKKYFEVKETPRLNNFTKDGRRFLRDANKKYDYVFSDAYSSFYSMPEHLTTKEFFELAKEKLNDKGVFIANVVGNLEPKAESFALSEMKTFKSVFDNSYFFAVDSLKSSKPQNIIFVGYNGEKTFDFKSAGWQAEIKNNKNPIIGGLAEKQIDLNNFDLSGYPILTDNFAPVDYLISREFRRYD